MYIYVYMYSYILIYLFLYLGAIYVFTFYLSTQVFRPICYILKSKLLDLRNDYSCTCKWSIPSEINSYLNI